MNKELTHREVELLRWIKKYQDKYEISPSYQEIAVGFGISKQGIQQHLRSAEYKGYIETTPRRTGIIFLKDV